MFLPCLVAIIYREQQGFVFLSVALVCIMLGTLMTCRKPNSHIFYLKEGCIITSLSWIVLSIFGALPFIISREIPSFTDALFETISGFTTTGASILTDVEALSYCMLFWRSFTHWIGGMGVLVFLLAIIPLSGGSNINLMRAESPGPSVGKLVPKMRQTARILYSIYLFLTILQFVLLIIGKMPIFDAICTSFGTAGTGGFGIKADSIGGYSPYIQWVVAIFMLLFGVNFNLFYLILIGKVRSALKSSELWIYFGIIALATFAIGINVANLFDSFGDTLRHSIFQVAAIITTTGFSTTDFTVWPEFSKMVIIVLMFIGGMAGSTAGGLKISRIMILFKTVRRDLKKMLHPRSIGVIKQEGKTVEDETIANTSIYIVVYFIIFFISMLLISFEPFGLETSFSSVASCINNIGPAYGAAASNFSCYSDFSTIVLSVVMLLGRLEIFPLLLAFAPSTWLKK
jgi:trk system potassium uptake protein TrkH